MPYMVKDLTPNKAVGGEPLGGVVCPNCFRPLGRFEMGGPDAMPDGCMLRAYEGCCRICDHQCQVLQFARAGVWPMAGYRLDGGRWTHVQSPSPLPEAVPPVVTGPGGAYRSDYTPAVSDVLTRSRAILLQVIEVLKEAIDLTRLEESRRERRR